MKQIPLTQAAEKVVEIKMKAVDRLIEELVEPLADVGNPEKLIKKPYEQWDANDIQLLTKIYGQGEDTPLTRTIFNRTYENVKNLEAEEGI